MRSAGDLSANNTLQVTFDPLRTFAATKARIALNAPKCGRSVDASRPRNRAADRADPTTSWSTSQSDQKLRFL